MALLLWEDLNLLLFSLGGLFAGCVVTLLARLTRAKDSYLGYNEKLGRRETVPLGPYSIPASWINSGSPVIRSATFGRSHDRSTSSGLWECTGPAAFEWHYGTDESIYILEGSAHIEYLGRKFTLSTGDCTHFAAGTVARWVVPERVKKSYTCYNPGRLVRKLRGLFRKLGWRNEAHRKAAP